MAGFDYGLIAPVGAVRRLGQACLDNVEHILDRCCRVENDLLRQELRLFVINSRRCHGHVEAANSERRDLDVEEFGALDERSRCALWESHLPAPSTCTASSIRLLALALSAIVRGVVRNLAANDFAIEWQGLQHDIEAASVLVREHKTEIQPEVILALALDHAVGAVRRLLCVSILRHVNSPFMSGL